MSKINNVLMVTLVAILMTAPAASAQQQRTQTSASNTEDDYAIGTGFKNKLFEIKYRDPNSLLSALRPLGSGYRGATMSVNQEFKTLAVRDMPENIAVIEEALRRLDKPEPPRPSIEFRVHVLIATNAGTVANDYPAELKDVIAQLQSTLKYKNYGLMASAIHRAKEGPSPVTNRGVAEFKIFGVQALQANPIFYSYSFQPITLEAANGGGPSTVEIGNFSFEMRVPVNLGTNIQYEPVGFRTPISLREGERVVVGTTTIEDKALVIVVSAKVIK